MFLSRATTLACKTGYIFLHFSGERRQARSERGAPDTREGGRYLEELQIFGNLQSTCAVLDPSISKKP